MSESLVCVEDFEKHAQSVLPKKVFDFYYSGAGAQETLIENKKAFSRYVMLKNCSLIFNRLCHVRVLQTL